MSDRYAFMAPDARRTVVKGLRDYRGRCLRPLLEMLGAEVYDPVHLGTLLRGAIEQHKTYLNAKEWRASVTGEIYLGQPDYQLADEVLGRLQRIHADLEHVPLADVHNTGTASYVAYAIRQQAADLLERMLQDFPELRDDWGA
ncbi:MAG: hypothetical protein HYY37_04845 [Candidatus Aenigmarchaeota archaeon]|nr:hypothetical protein [Candidatus Aenigmarchaeota archaeon]